MTKEIELTQGYKTTVDDEDFEYLSQFKWHFSAGYVIRIKYDASLKRDRIGMHQIILGRKLGRKLIPGELPDHVDNNPLNNTRQNIRVSTHKQNMRNKPKRRTQTTSRFKGVSLHSTGNKWQSQIMVDGKIIYIGLFSDEELAAKAYDQVALRQFGEFARLNFPN